jgi:predicted alpha/beta hydrolase family esterase
MTLKHTILIIPGLRDHVEEHWQTLLAKELTAQSVPCVTVPPLEQDKLSCQARLDAIDRALDSIDGPVIIVAHSAGCMMVAHWALRRARPILGLACGPRRCGNPDACRLPPKDVLAAHGWTPIPRQRLPFPTLLAASSNDPLTQLERARGFARDWGSELVELGPQGHLNPASGHGPWPQAKQLIEDLQARIEARQPEPTA